MKLALRIMRHEGYYDQVDVFDRSVVCNDPADPWSANCSIPKLLFFNKKKAFETAFPQYRVIHKELGECFMFFLSGGVIAKTFYVPIGDKKVKGLQRLDKALVKICPNLFAAGCQVVLKRIE